MTQITLHNTLTGRKEAVTPLTAGRIGLYCCGPTVYNFAHIGNLRTYLFEDLLRRTFAYCGYKVAHVMNVTDIGHLTGDADDGEDKMLRSATEQQKSVREIADHYSAAFFRDCQQLNILYPHTVCRATDHIDDMIALAQRIEAQGAAYRSGGNLYFDTAKFPGYGLGRGGRGEDQALLQGRVERDAAKRNLSDFVLWFTQSKYEHQAMTWDSPWGRGYPGWHLECSAMSMHYLGEQFDIHCGGVDHIPIHHTNEIAQVEVVTHKPWVRYWVHGEFLLMDDERISKSSGSFTTLSDLAANGFEPLDFRYFCLSGHYRSQLRFSEAALTTARNARLRLVERLANLVHQQPTALAALPEEAAASAVVAAADPAIASPAATTATASSAVAAADPAIASPAAATATATASSAPARALLAQGWRAMANDLNSPQLLSVLWQAVKSNACTVAERLAVVGSLDAVLGLELIATVRALLTQEQQRSDTLADADAERLVRQRSEARAARQWQLADQLRDQLQSAGIVVVDKSDGAHWFRG